MSGLGLEDFLNQSQRGGKAILERWKEAGSIIVWPHVGAMIASQGIMRRFSHTFLIEDEVEDKDRPDRMKMITRYPRFVCPDSDVIADAGAKWRDKKTGVHNALTDGPRVVTDPFIIVREHLFHMVKNDLLSTDQTVFSWADHKTRGRIEWMAGHITGHVERGRDNFGANLDAKCEYIFIVVQNEDPGAGPTITFETKTLGDAVRKLFKDEMESNGDKGDPRSHPYAMKWTYDKHAKTPALSYTAARYNRAECSDAIWDAMNTEEWPDASKYAVAQEGDMEKIREALEKATQIDLPLDEIFSEDPDVRLKVANGNYAKSMRSGVSSSAGAARQPSQERVPPAPQGTGATRPPTRPGADVPATRGAAPARQTTQADREPPQRTAAAPAPATEPAPQSRRKKVEKPEPEPVKAPEPSEPTEPCENCGHPMLLTESKCPKCGTEYEVVTDEEAPDVFDEAIEKQEVRNGATRPSAERPSTSSGATRPTAKASPQAGTKACWSCSSTDLHKDKDGKIVCASCGIDQGDDMPFN